MSYVHGNPNPTFTLNQFIQASLANPEVANVPGPDDWIDKNTISVLSGWTAGVFAIGQKDSLLETLLNHRFSMRKARSTPQFVSPILNVSSSFSAIARLINAHFL
jgi:hypothetical protein